MKKIIAQVWTIFKRTPLGWLIRKLSPQWLVNLLEHLPVAILANIVYAFPSRKIRVIGVTGTDGKTTTVNMIYQILKHAGKKVSMVSTINAVLGGQSYDTGFHVTSPHSFTVQEFISKALKSGSDYIVLEVTSHALDQNRFWGVKFEVGVITNITHEHLDYHKTFERYLQTKAKLIKNVKMAVLNRDDRNFNRLKKLTRKYLAVSLHKKDADLNLGKLPLVLRIPGDYNLTNALEAAAVAKYFGIGQQTIKEALKNFKPLPGRMEEVANNKGVKIFIDYAHTPNGLEQALKALQKGKKGKLIALIGAEGYRDVGKRPLLGEVAVKYADSVVVTAVDPRGLIEQINKQILEGAEKAGGKLNENLFVENDRRKAISLAVNKLARRGDTVAIFGKGHETSMNLDGKKELPWSDKQAVLEILG